MNKEWLMFPSAIFTSAFPGTVNCIINFMNVWNICVQHIFKKFDVIDESTVIYLSIEE